MAKKKKVTTQGNKQITEFYSEDGKVIRRKVATINNEKSMTDQSAKDSTDAKLIVKQFLKTGLVQHINKASSHFSDV